MSRPTKCSAASEEYSDTTGTAFNRETKFMW